MPEQTPRKRRPATALIAFARALAMEESVDSDEVDALVDSVCMVPPERIALLAALQQVNNPELSIVMSDLFSRRVARLREQESTVQDIDDVLGVWTQRLSAGALLAAAGAAIAGALTGNAAVAALLIPALGGIAVAFGRLSLRKRRSRLHRAREETESLMRHVLETLK